jgi:large subunit ribosomal protein L4
MPKKQRKLARDSAVLAKLLNGDVVVIDELDFEKPRTADFAGILDNLKIDRSCLVTTSDYNENLCKSARNVPRIAIMPVAELNAGDICNYRKMLFTKEAFMNFLSRGEDSESQ